MHLFERDCSIQRRHQKVVEIAPAPNISDELRAGAVRRRGDVRRVDQLLLRRHGGVPGRDRGPAGRPARLHRDEPADPGRAHGHRGDHRRRPGPGADADRVRGDAWPISVCRQDIVRINGAALQCRITTEDPANGFRPDTGTITAYRSAGGAGVRLDGGTVDTGVEISAHFDSMLVKLTCRGRTFEAAVARARRALAEFRIRGVSTNIPFLQAVLEDPDFIAGDVSTAFIEERPELLTTHAPADRGTRLLRWLAEVTVNKPYGEAPTLLDPGVKRPAGVDLDQAVAARAPGSGCWSSDRRGSPPTCGRGRASRSPTPPSATRTSRCSPPGSGPRTCCGSRRTSGRMTPELFSVECWGGATYDVALRFIAEDPWERLAALRYNMPGLCLQMLLRGRNTVGYTPYPTKVTTSFVAEAAEVGIDIFRIFDALNDVEQMRPAIEAVLRDRQHDRRGGAVLHRRPELARRRTSTPSTTTCGWPRRSSRPGRTSWRSRTWPGCCGRRRRKKLVAALRRAFDLPVHLHTHDTAGGQLATLLAAVDAGVDAVDVASAPMAGTTIQVPASALVAALENTERATNLDLRAVMDLEPYWEAVRKVYKPFESGLPAPTGRVYDHEIPGGQLSNLRQQAIALGLGEKFEQIEAMYAAASRILGRPTKVTPSSKVVGDLALQLVAVGADPDDFAANPQNYDIPDSVIGFLGGELGDPPGGWPEPFRTKALQGRTVPVPRCRAVRRGLAPPWTTRGRSARRR